MAEIRKTPTQLLVQERTGRAVDELLRDLYVEKRHSQKEIASALTTATGIQIARSTVNAWLLELGITREDRPAVAL